MMTTPVSTAVSLAAVVGLLSASGTARCAGPDQGPPGGRDEATLSAQQLADEFLVVRARLTKPGRVPEYELGEPVVVELDIRNMSERQGFRVPVWGAGFGVPGSSGGSASQYVVEATRDGRPAPLTARGRRSVENLGRAEPFFSGGVVNVFMDDSPPLRKFDRGGTVTPTPASVIANVLCDMTDHGDYELGVRFCVKVVRLEKDRLREENAVKVVRPTPPLRLRVVERLHRLEPPPVNAPRPPG